MRRSIKSYVSGMAVVFSSHLPYTALHNEGGNFSVTAFPEKSWLLKKFKR